ncbi:MAG: hypothetical protein MUC60_01365 [Oscillatoria sp. Prado101]|nr:hypothetical protein [Oscillatoria sp. Prado101]
MPVALWRSPLYWVGVAVALWRSPPRSVCGVVPVALWRSPPYWVVPVTLSCSSPYSI